MNNIIDKKYSIITVIVVAFVFSLFGYMIGVFTTPNNRLALIEANIMLNSAYKMGYEDSARSIYHNTKTESCKNEIMKVYEDEIKSEAE